MPNIEYISADLKPPFSMVNMDITNILFKDNFFDVVLCIYVLEHIQDDEKAMRELFRGLKPGVGNHITRLTQIVEKLLRILK